MHRQNKVIITCAVTGAIHTPSMSPYLPVTPEEIAEASIAAAEAGAAIIHLHARDPVTGKPDQRPEAFLPFLQRIRQGCDAVAHVQAALREAGGDAVSLDAETRIRRRVGSPAVSASSNG